MARGKQKRRAALRRETERVAALDAATRKLNAERERRAGAEVQARELQELRAEIGTLEQELHELTAERVAAVRDEVAALEVETARLYAATHDPKQRRKNNRVVRAAARGRSKKDHRAAVEALAAAVTGEETVIPIGVDDHAAQKLGTEGVVRIQQARGFR